MSEQDGLYSERARLVAYIASQYPSSLERSDPSPGFEYVVYIETPEGQLSWHVADADLAYFWATPRDAGRRWDGHTDEEKWLRLQRLATSGKRAPTHLSVQVELVRQRERGKCPVCGKRRVLVALHATTRETLATVARPRCFDCAGMR